MRVRASVPRRAGLQPSHTVTSDCRWGAQRHACANNSHFPPIVARSSVALGRPASQPATNQPPTHSSIQPEGPSAIDRSIDRQSGSVGEWQHQNCPRDAPLKLLARPARSFARVASPAHEIASPPCTPSGRLALRAGDARRALPPPPAWRRVRGREPRFDLQRRPPPLLPASPAQVRRHDAVQTGRGVGQAQRRPARTAVGQLQSVARCAALCRRARSAARLVPAMPAGGRGPAARVCAREGPRRMERVAAHQRSRRAALLVRRRWQRAATGKLVELGNAHPNPSRVLTITGYTQCRAC